MECTHDSDMRYCGTDEANWHVKFLIEKGYIEICDPEPEYYYDEEDLRLILKSRGLNTEGLKPELIGRLMQSLSPDEFEEVFPKKQCCRLTAKGYDYGNFFIFEKRVLVHEFREEVCELLEKKYEKIRSGIASEVGYLYLPTRSISAWDKFMSFESPYANTGGGKV
ncbi:MAG: hypothetical protein GX907_03970 [Clostridiaceae bacterium]|nr:hypothetical protein [Clostridiaceae bacterium]